MSKQVFKNERYISVASNYDLAEMLTEYNLGGDIDYPIEAVRKEISFRELIGEWITNEPTYKDEGCGHDQNDNYYND